MAFSRAVLVALLVALSSLVAAPATAEDYGPCGVFGSPNGGCNEEGDDIDVRFEAIGVECESWTVTQDETGEAPSGGGGGSTFSFTVSPDEGTYSITAQCNTAGSSSTTDQCNTTTSSMEGGGSRGSLGTVVQGAGETFDTITFTVGEEGSCDDDDGEGDGDGDGDRDGDENGGLPNTGGRNVQLLLLGGALATVGAAILLMARRRRAL